MRSRAVGAVREGTGKGEIGRLARDLLGGSQASIYW